MKNFRPLTAEDIECRVGTVSAKGCSILLYKNARVDMNVLDDTVGPENWQNEFVDVGGRLVCRLGIKVDGEWVWKADTGVEGTVGEEKSTASDARKRAGFAWGIGRELYNSPFIWLNLETERRNDGRYQLKQYPRLEVTEFESDGRNVTRLAISDASGNVIFRHGDTLKQARKTAKPAGQAPAPAPVAAQAPATAPILTATFDDSPESIELSIALKDLRSCQSRADVLAVDKQYRAVYGEYGSQRNESYINALYEMCTRFPKQSVR